MNGRWKSFNKEFNKLKRSEISKDNDSIKELLRNMSYLVSDNDLDGVVRGILRIQKMYRLECFYMTINHLEKCPIFLIS